MGLIQVMKHLENIEEVGRGIAVAFVATVYGVAVANLIFLPAANKLKARIHKDVQAKELILEGVAEHCRRHESEADSGQAGGLSSTRRQEET